MVLTAGYPARGLTQNCLIEGDACAFVLDPLGLNVDSGNAVQALSFKLRRILDPKATFLDRIFNLYNGYYDRILLSISQQIVGIIKCKAPWRLTPFWSNNGSLYQP